MLRKRPCPVCSALHSMDVKACAECGAWMTHETTVVFRSLDRHKGGTHPEVIALFPEIPARDVGMGWCKYLSEYVPDGSTHCKRTMHNTRTPSGINWIPFKNNMENILGYRLKVVRRTTPAMHKKRIAAFRVLKKSHDDEVEAERATG